MERRIALFCVLLIVSLAAPDVFAANHDKDINILRKHVASLETRVGKMEKTLAALRSENQALRAEIAALKSAPTVTPAAVAVKVAPAMVQPTGGSDLTPEELAAIEAYLDARVQWYRKVYGTEWDAPSHRSPYVLCAEYESYKSEYVEIGGERYYRFKTRPEFPGWQDACYQWYPDGKYVEEGGEFTESQLYCSKCQAWVLADGRTCWQKHPIPLMDQWRFCVALIAQRTEKPGDRFLRRGGLMEAKAVLWDALQHGDLTEAQWDQLMTESF